MSRSLWPTFWTCCIGSALLFGIIADDGGKPMQVREIRRREAGQWRDYTKGENPPLQKSVHG